jgi:hypothetical protein
LFASQDVNFFGPWKRWWAGIIAFFSALRSLTANATRLAQLQGKSYCAMPLARHNGKSALEGNNGNVGPSTENRDPGGG